MLVGIALISQNGCETTGGKCAWCDISIKDTGGAGNSLEVLWLGPCFHCRGRGSSTGHWGTKIPPLGHQGQAKKNEKKKKKKTTTHERCFPLSTFHAKWPAWGLLVGSCDLHPCHLTPSLTSPCFYEGHLHHSWALTAQLATLSRVSLSRGLPLWLSW